MRKYVFISFITFVAASLTVSCDKNNNTETLPEQKPDPVLTPTAPVITDLSETLENELMHSSIRFEVEVGTADSAYVHVTTPDGEEVFNKDIVTGSANIIDVDDLEPETVYTINATAVNIAEDGSQLSASASLEISTAAEPKYLTLIDATENSYAFRVYSKSETGFWFTSGEYAALDYIVPGWSTDNQESLEQILMYLYPFEGMGDMTIECVDGEQPEWAEIPIEVFPDTHYFILAADKDAEGNIIGDVAFLDFNTL